MNSAQLDTFVDETMADLQNTFSNNINDLRDRIKSARPDPADPNYAAKMDMYQELIKEMLPVIQKIQGLAGEILDELKVLIDHLWDDICKNNGARVDRLLDEHAYRTEMRVRESFLVPLDVLEKKLQRIHPQRDH